MEPPFNYPPQAVLIPLADIERNDRIRRDYGNLAELFEEFKNTGLIHPPTVARRADGKYTLVAGGRRTAAMELGGLTHIPVLCFDELPIHKIVEMEGNENGFRKNFDWREQCLWIARAHELRTLAATEDRHSWGMRETGQLLGVSVATVSHAYQVRAFINANDAEVLGADSLKQAYDILLARREREAMAATASFSGNVGKVTSGFIGDIDIDAVVGELLSAPSEPVHRARKNADDGSDNITLDDLYGVVEQPTVQKPVLEAKVFALSKMLFLGDSMEILPKIHANTVDHVVTDIPYGIDMDNLDRIKNLDTVVDTHDKDQNVSMMLPFLRESFRILKPNGFCVFWYDLDHHEKLQNWAKQVGFNVQRWPIVWHKLHPCINNSATKNFTKNVEFAMVLRKGNASILSPQASCVVAADGSADRKLYDNPFAKPGHVWRFIYQAIASRGQIVLDPFMGQMSSLRAAVDLGLTPMGIEIDRHHFLAGLNGIKNKLTEITNGSAVFE